MTTHDENGAGTTTTLEVTDEQLAEQAATGDHGALRRLWNRHEPALRRRLERALSREVRLLTPVDDLLQEVLKGLWEAIETRKTIKVNGPGSVAAYLHGICDNKKKDALRLNEREKKRRDAATRTAPKVTDEGDGPERGPVAMEAIELLRRRTGGLTEKQREAYDLVLLRGLSHKDVAKILGTTPGAVQKLNERARDNMRRFEIRDMQCCAPRLQATPMVSRYLFECGLRRGRGEHELDFTYPRPKSPVHRTLRWIVLAGATAAVAWLLLA